MPSLSPKRATLLDVAELAGVSRQTVSRVINESPHVSSKARRRVLQAIDQLGYSPNQMARSLRGKQGHILEVIVAYIEYYGQAQLIRSIERAAQAKGYKLMLSSLEGTDPERISYVLGNVQGRVVDGVIFFAFVQNEFYKRLIQACTGFPYIEINRELGAQTASVLTDQYCGGKLATQYLIDQGHTAIAEISGPFRWHASRTRHKAWLDTLRANGLTPGVSLEGDWTPASGFKAMQQLLDSSAPFSAVFCGNDQMALGVMAALQERGLCVPDDISIIGFDDIPEGAYFCPPLTTIREDYDELGKQSVEYLLEIIQNPEAPRHQRVLYPTLVERKSVRALR
ncbi:MAG: LacI family DNA-binding transcriptional regulator [Anaerolineae bacterium]|nr:LacI family DNA-binding transcriptional regulator [Anaerolineae bacterium]